MPLQFLVKQKWLSAIWFISKISHATTYSLTTGFIGAAAAMASK